MIDLRRRSVRVSSFLPPWDFVMLDPAFTFARPHPDPHPDHPHSPDFLASSLGTHPGGRNLQALFLPQVMRRFAHRLGRSSGKGGKHVFHVLEGCLRLSHHARWPACHSWLQPRWRTPRRVVPQHLSVHRGSHDPGPAQTACARFHELVDGSQDFRSQLLTEISSEMTAAHDPDHAPWSDGCR